MSNDPDLPGERATFVPVTAQIDYSGPRPAWVMPHSIEYQTIVHHNQLRYAELQRLRMGQPNLYNETQYRH